MYPLRRQQPLIFNPRALISAETSSRGRATDGRERHFVIGRDEAQTSASNTDD